MEVPVVLATSTNMTKEGDSIVLMCQCNGTLPLVYSWVKDDNLIGGTLSYLVINKLTREDTGLYTCRVTNRIGTKHSNKTAVKILCKYDLVQYIFT